ncbi:hypothetical protein [Trinickia fusca]|uniref:Uncharacterized protein n=1 Tax=Trinickia fusca TaxID=2419777 RepID=A0A494XY46_9BURK|nr:hypothetical protein [Trinickia fusca]RKP52503.1 hypothetical protein D7S89_03050 [Trinickia fusca]
MKNPVLSVGRLLIGRGPTAIEALSRWAQRTPHAKADGVDLPLAIVGRPGAQPFDWQHVLAGLRLGQSSAALNLVGTQSGPPSGGFAKVEELQKSMRWQKQTALELGKGLEINGTVTKIEKYDHHEIVATVSSPGCPPLEIIASEVIAALGAGPERSVNVPTQKRHLGIERPFGEYLTGSQGVSTGLVVKSGSIVLIVGDGPTAMWNAEVCTAYGAIPYVVGPNNGRAFLSANPGGRNSQTLRFLREHGLLFTGDIAGFEERNQLNDFGDMREPGILVYFKNLTNLSNGSFKSSSVLPVSRVVSAIGSSAPAMSYFAPYIVSDMAPLVVHGQEGRAAVGIATTHRDIVVVGAQSHSLGVSQGLDALFNAPGTQISQPPPGILANRANIRSVMREYARIKLGARVEEMPLIRALFMDGELDAMTSSHVELSQYLQNRAGVPRLAAAEMAVKILEKRGDYHKKNRDFTNRELAALLKEMNVKVGVVA